MASRAIPPCALLWALLLAATGCGGEDHRPATWAYVHAAIVAPSCATVACHSRATGAGALELEDQGPAHAHLLERRYIRPGDPASPLMYLLQGTERDVMPPDGPLPPADIELIRRWISEGANP
jgi:hypothetical protein